MARVIADNINTVSTYVSPVERTFYSSSIDLRVQDMYVKKGYDKKPKTREEADAAGERDFNALVATALSLHVKPWSTGSQLIVSVAPTRYLIRQAMADVVKEQNITDYEDLWQLSPKVFGVSLIAPVVHNGKHYLLAQIKGKALGSGEVHTGIVAGGMNMKEIDRLANERAPALVETLRRQSSEELGLKLDTLTISNFNILLDERETGHVSLAAVAQQADLTHILQTYEAMTKPKLENKESLEVMGITKLPIAGLALVPIEGKDVAKGITVYLPTPEGLVEKVEDRGVRPPTKAMAEYLADPANQKSLLEKAGF